MRSYHFAFALFLISGQAMAGWKQDVPNANLCGQGGFSTYGFDIYVAQLWGRCDNTLLNAPFALQLTYRRDIERRKIVDASLDEMKRLATSPVSDTTLEHWRRLMNQAFVDVSAGDSLAGVFLPGRGVKFYAGDRLTANIDDLQFAKAFFNIWLDQKTRAPDLRNNLLR